MAKRPVKPGPRKKAGPRPRADVVVGVKLGRIACEPSCLYVNRGDKIVWRFDPGHAYAVIIKVFAGPLDWDFAVVRRGAGRLRAAVARDAKPGFYPYAVVAEVEGRLLVADPEIIIPPPRGGH